MQYHIVCSNGRSCTSIVSVSSCPIYFMPQLKEDSFILDERTNKQINQHLQSYQIVDLISMTYK